MKNSEIGIACLVTGLLIAIGIVVWGLSSHPTGEERKLNALYTEDVKLKNEAFRTEVWIDGTERPDCSFSRGAEVLTCSSDPPTIEQGKK